MLKVQYLLNASRLSFKVQQVSSIFTISSLAINSKAMATSSSAPLTGRVNPTTGKLEWVVEDENYDYVQEIARSSYTDMLHDEERNKKYLIGIQKAIASIKSRGKEAHVLDIGTGTGLLAMMSAQSGADTVVACEAFEPIGRAARQIVAKNGFKDLIKVIMKRSTELTVGPVGDLSRRANILPAEVFDTELVGEGAIPTYLHAHKHLLTEDCICVPHSATVYAQVIESTYLEQCHKLQPINVPDSDDIIPPSRMTRCEGAASVFDLQLSQLSPDLFKPITEPLRMLDFNFSKGDFKARGGNRVEAHSLRKGRCHCVFMWWELQMDQAGEVILSTAPTWVHPDGDKAPWRDHWMQAVYFLPTSTEVEKGQSLDVTVSHDDYSLWFSVFNSSAQPVVERPICQCGAHVVWSRQRFAMMNQVSRNDKFISALQKVVNSSTTCMSVSDGSLLPLIAARLGACQVYSLEPNSMSRKVMQEIVEANDLSGKVELIPQTAQDLKLEDKEYQIDLLVSEPFFTSGLLPWHSLYFWYCRTALAGRLAEGATILPCGARLRAVAVQFEHLWKFHAPVGDLEGFDVRIFDDLTQRAAKDTDAKEEPHHLWEYPGCPLTSDFDLMQFDFTSCIPDEPINVTGEIPFVRPGTCHGIAIWMDFQLDAETTVTTGLLGSATDKLEWCRTWKQGVHFLKHNPIIEDEKTQKLSYKASFKPNSGNIFFEFQVVAR